MKTPTPPIPSAIGEDDNWILQVMPREEADKLKKRLLEVAERELNTISITLTMTHNSAIATCQAYRRRQATGDQVASELIEKVIKNFIDAAEFRLEEYDIIVDEQE